MLDDISPIILYSVIVVGVIFAVYVAVQEIKASKTKSELDKLYSILKVFKRQLNDLKNADTRLFEEIRIYEGKDKQKGFELRLIDNVAKETVIVNEIKGVLDEIFAIDPSDLRLEYGYHRNELKRLIIIQKHVNRIELEHRRNSNQPQSILG